jgi:hypothetical protein
VPIIAQAAGRYSWELVSFRRAAHVPKLRLNQK